MKENTILDFDGVSLSAVQALETGKALSEDGRSFIRISELSRMLGVSENSIRSQMRVGIFPIPHRHIGNLIVVKRDDYSRWFETAESQGRRARKSMHGKTETASAPIQQPAGGNSCRARRLARPESQTAKKERQHREVMNALRREGLLTPRI